MPRKNKEDRLTRIEKILDRLTRESEKSRQDIDRVSKNIDKLTKESEKYRQDLGKLTDGWGKFVEGLVAPSVPTVFAQEGFKIETIYQRAKRHKDGETLEIDILGIGINLKNGKGVVIAVEASSDFSKKEFVDEFLEELDRFFEFFPEYKDKELLGAFAGIRVVGGVDKYTLKKGLYVLKPSGEIMIMEKPSEPKIWRSK